MEYDKIKQELRKQYETLSEKYDLFGVFVYGSQNYGVDNKDSDIDTKAIIVPNLDNLIFNKPLSKTVEMDSGECDCKDIRQMFSMLLKQNINYLEILFTDYYIINYKYKKYFNQLLKMKEDIARYDEKKAAACILGLFNNEYNRLFKPEYEDVEKYGYRRKSYCNLNRLVDTLDKYIKGKPYKECISNPKYKNLKTRILPVDMIQKNAYTLNYNIEDSISEFMPSKVDHEIKEKMDNIIREIISNNLV